MCVYPSYVVFSLASYNGGIENTRYGKRSDKEGGYGSTDLTRGCGGVAILWRKSLCVISIQVESDRIVVVRVRTVNCDSLTIIGTYMPDTSQPLEKYTECLT